jgi:hypothetical protein
MGRAACRGRALQNRDGFEAERIVRGGPRRDDLDGAGDLLGNGRLGERGVEGASGETVGHEQKQ